MTQFNLIWRSDIRIIVLLYYCINISLINTILKSLKSHITTLPQIKEKQEPKQKDTTTSAITRTTVSIRFNLKLSRRKYANKIEKLCFTQYIYEYNY